MEDYPHSTVNKERFRFQEVEDVCCSSPANFILETSQQITFCLTKQVIRVRGMSASNVLTVSAKTHSLDRSPSVAPQYQSDDLEKDILSAPANSDSHNY